MILCKMVKSNKIKGGANMADTRVTTGQVVKEAQDIGYIRDWSYSRRGNNGQPFNIIFAGQRVTDCFKPGDHIVDLDVRTRAGKIRSEKFLRFLSVIELDGKDFVLFEKVKEADMPEGWEAIREMVANREELIKQVDGGKAPDAGDPKEVTMDDINKKVEEILGSKGEEKTEEVAPAEVDKDKVAEQYPIVNEKPRIPNRLKGRFLKALREENPRRDGTHGHRDYQMLMDHGGEMAVEDYIKKGGRVNNLDWDVGHEFAALNDAPTFNKGIEKKKKITKDILPEWFPHMVNLATIRQNILMVGPSGCGKTYIANKLAEKLGLPFGAQSCSAGMSESQLAGYLLPVGDSGKFEYIASTFVDMYENGGVFLFDEIDAADENTMVFINAALANGSFYLPQRFNNREIRRHPDFIAVAAANTFGHGESVVYSGRNQLDGATLDRFRAGMIICDYSPVVEKALGDDQIVRWARRVRQLINKQGLNRIMSTRVILDFTRQKEELGYGMGDFVNSYFADWAEDEKEMAKADGLML